MINRKTLLILSSLFICNSASANDNVTSVVDSFFNCDNSFFHQLKDNVEDFSVYSDLNVKDEIAYIPVNDISSDNDFTYTFRQPINYRGLVLTSYINKYINTYTLGKYYYWGFIVNNSISDIQNKFEQFSWQPFSENTFITNSQRFDNQKQNKGWENYPYSFDGVAPRANTTEKMIYLEKINDNQTYLLCSLQGDITKDILYSIHPDMQYIAQELADKIKAKNKISEEVPSQDDIQTPIKMMNDETKVNKDM